MALTFPSNPTLNQVYSTGSLSWTWNGKSWNNGTSILATSNLVSSSVQFTNGNTTAFDTTSNITVGQITASFAKISGSIFGTASFATNAFSASYAPNIYVLPSNVVSSSAQLSNNGGVAFDTNSNITVGQITASFAKITNLTVQYVTSSVMVITGSNKFGDASNDTQEFTGSVSMSGSLSVTGTLSATGIASFIGLKAQKATATSGFISAIDEGANVYNVLGSRNNADNAYLPFVIRGSSVTIGATSDIATISSTGLGIGTSSPAAKLHISGTNAGIILDRVTADVDPSGIQGSIYVKENGISNYEAMMFRATGYRWQSDDGTDRMLINSSGNVGIGTSTTTKRLHIYSGETAVGASQFNIEGVIGGYGAGITFTSLLGSTSTLKEMARITADGEAAWNATASTQDAGLRFYTTSQGTTAERMRINNAGKVGIGTSSPSAMLDIQSASGSGNSVYMRGGTYSDIAYATGIRFLQPASTSNSNRQFRFTSGDSSLTIQGIDGAGTDTSDTKLILQSSGGNVGIGTTSPAYKLVVNDVNDVRIQLDSSTTQGFYFTKAGANNGTYRVDTNGNFEWYTKTVSQAMTLTAAGNLLVGTTSAGGKLVVTQTASSTNAILVDIQSTSTKFCELTYQGSNVGSISYNGSNTVYATTSDYRLKDLTGPLTDSGAFIDSLKPKVGTWKSNGSKFVGFIAHEFAEVSPTSVCGERDAVDADGKPVYQAMQASSAEVIANLVAELQSLRQRVAALEAK
jgi:hypothetical protein